jgi:endonuclease/exonuclease/phosphatase (EEP) superfamily protein YafD
VRELDRWLLAIPLAAAIVIIATWIVPGDGGPYAILTIFSAHLAFAALVVTAVLALVRGRALRPGLLVLVVVSVARFGSEWVSLPSTSGHEPFTVATWNMEWDVAGGPDALAGLAEQDADVIALQELTPEQAAAIEGSAAATERYPFRQLEPGSTRTGIGLLSRFPLTDIDVAADPPSIRATVDRGEAGDPVTVLTAHPFSPRIRTRGPGPIDVPVGYDVSDRDRRLAEIRRRLDGALALGTPVVLIGDLNTAPTEAADRDLTAGLLDAHVEVGEGPGWTWRPGLLGPIPAGVLRIDRVLSTTDLLPVESRVVCRSVGDHCQVLAGFVPRA